MDYFGPMGNSKMIESDVYKPEDCPEDRNCTYNYLLRPEIQKKACEMCVKLFYEELNS